MEILTAIKKLAATKAEQVIAWNNSQGVFASNYNDLTQAVQTFIIGKLDAKLAELSFLDGAEISNSEKDRLLNLIKETGLKISSISSLTSFALKDSNIAYCPSIAVGSSDLSYCFSNNSFLFAVEPLDCASVTNANYIFYNCTNLSQIKISDFTSLKSGEYAFCKCQNLTSLSFSDLAALTSGSYMFQDCVKLKIPSELSLPVLSNGSWMFCNCKQIDFIQLNLPELTDGRSMFSGCSSLNSISITGLSKLSLCASMFLNCTALKSVEVTDLPKLTSAIDFFATCTQLTSLSELYLPLLKDATRMFLNCYKLSSISFKTGSLVKTNVFFRTFDQCLSLARINGLCLAGVYLDLSSNITSETYLTAIKLSLPSSLTDCELQGTLYRSGFTLVECPNLSAASLFSWVAALYDWETNEESKTTIDSDHTLYLTSAQLSTLEEYEGDGTKTGAEVIEQAITYGWNLSE